MYRSSLRALERLDRVKEKAGRGMDYNKPHIAIPQIPQYAPFYYKEMDDGQGSGKHKTHPFGRNLYTTGGMKDLDVYNALPEELKDIDNPRFYCKPRLPGPWTLEEAQEKPANYDRKKRRKQAELRRKRAKEKQDEQDKQEQETLDALQQRIVEMIEAKQNKKDQTQ